MNDSEQLITKNPQRNKGKKKEVQTCEQKLTNYS